MTGRGWAGQVAARQGMIVSKTIAELSVDSDVLYRELRKLEIGEVATYAALTASIGGRSVQESARGNLTTAIRLCQREDGLIIAAVRGVGVKRLDSAGIVGLGSNAIAATNRRTRRVLKKLSCVDYGELSDGDRIRHNATLSMLGALHQATTRATAVKLEAAVKASDGKLPWSETLKLL